MRNKFPRPLCNSVIVLEHAWGAVEDTKGGNILECGVHEGFTSALLKFGLNKNSHKTAFYAADTFQGFPYDGKEDEKYKKGELSLVTPGNYSVIGQLDYLNINVLVGKIENTLPRRLEDEEFSFVFLDLDLEEPTRFAWDFVKTRLKKGARVGIHDYGAASLPGITRICDEILREGEFIEVFRPSKGARDNRFLFVKRKGE